MKFTSTKEHCNADTLSRLPTSMKSELPVDNMIYSLPTDILPLTLTEIQSERLKDKTLINILTSSKW